MSNGNVMTPRNSSNSLNTSMRSIHSSSHMSSKAGSKNDNYYSEMMENNENGIDKTKTGSTSMTGDDFSEDISYDAISSLKISDIDSNGMTSESKKTNIGTDRSKSSKIASKLDNINNVKSSSSNESQFAALNGNNSIKSIPVMNRNSADSGANSINRSKITNRNVCCVF